MADERLSERYIGVVREAKGEISKTADLQSLNTELKLLWSAIHNLTGRAGDTELLSDVQMNGDVVIDGTLAVGLDTPDGNIHSTVPTEYYNDNLSEPGGAGHVSFRPSIALETTGEYIQDPAGNTYQAFPVLSMISTRTDGERLKTLRLASSGSGWDICGGESDHATVNLTSRVTELKNGVFIDGYGQWALGQRSVDANAFFLINGDAKSAQHGYLGGCLSVDNTVVGNVGAGEDLLSSYTLVGDKLDRDGRTVRITAWGTVAANANVKTLKIYFGATVVATGTIGGAAGGAWFYDALVHRTGAATQVAGGRGNSNAGAVNVFTTSSSPTETLSGDVLIKCTGEATATNDIVQRSLVIELIN